MTHDSLIKDVQRSGLKMSKEKILDLISRSKSVDLNISQSQNSKAIIAVITLA